MESDYAATYRELYQHHWWWRARERFLVRTLAEICPAGGFGRILDVGCGDGLFFDQLRTFGQPEGVEPAATLISDWGRRRGPIHVGELDATFDPGYRFGLITMLDVIEHIAEPLTTKVLERARELLAPGGYLVLTVPALQWLWTSHDDHNQHIIRYTRPLLRRVAGKAGFDAQRCHYFFHWLVLPKLLMRVREAISGGSPPAAIPRPFVNRALLSVSSIEQRVFGKLPLPIGSSLLYLATRPHG